MVCRFKCVASGRPSRALRARGASAAGGNRPGDRKHPGIAAAHRKDLAQRTSHPRHDSVRSIAKLLADLHRRARRAARRDRCRVQRPAPPTWPRRLRSRWALLRAVAARSCRGSWRYNYVAGGSSKGQSIKKGCCVQSWTRRLAALEPTNQSAQAAGGELGADVETRRARMPPPLPRRLQAAAAFARGGGLASRCRRAAPDDSRLGAAVPR
jgi:hypothetical protein